MTMRRFTLLVGTVVGMLAIAASTASAASKPKLVLKEDLETGFQTMEVNKLIFGYAASITLSEGSHSASCGETLVSTRGPEHSEWTLKTNSEKVDTITIKGAPGLKSNCSGNLEIVKGNPTRTGFSVWFGGTENKLELSGAENKSKAYPAHLKAAKTDGIKLLFIEEYIGPGDNPETNGCQYEATKLNGANSPQGGGGIESASFTAQKVKLESELIGEGKCPKSVKVSAVLIPEANDEFNPYVYGFIE